MKPICTTIWSGFSAPGLDDRTGEPESPRGERENLSERWGRGSKAALPLGDSEIRDQIRGWATDILSEGPRLFVLQRNPGAGGAYVFYLLSLMKLWALPLFCEFDNFPELNNSSTSCFAVSDLFVPPGRSHMTVDWGKKQRVHLSWVYGFMHTLTALLGSGCTL